VSKRLAIGVLVLAASVPPAAAAEAGPLRLAWVDPSGAARGLEFFAQAEASAQLRRAGLRVSWRRARAEELARADEVRVILLDRAATRGSGTFVLGATPARAVDHPHVWIHVPGIRSVLGFEVRPTPNEPRARTLAVAVGRVIAHEVIHSVAPAVPHGLGLMAPSFGCAQLTAPWIELDPGLALAVRAARGADPSAPLPRSGVVAAAGAWEERPR